MAKGRNGGDPLLGLAHIVVIVLAFFAITWMAENWPGAPWNEPFGEGQVICFQADYGVVVDAGAGWNVAHDVDAGAYRVTYVAPDGKAYDLATYDSSERPLEAVPATAIDRIADAADSLMSCLPSYHGPPRQGGRGGRRS